MKKRILALILSFCIVPLAFKSSDFEKAEAASKQLNIVTTFDISETATYGVPNAFFSRFDEMTEKVANLYYKKFGIKLNFTKPEYKYVIGTCASECRVNNYDSFCTHCTNANCSNSGPYHCTNSGVIKADVISKADSVTNAYQMHVAAVRVCNKSNGNHGSINGMHYSSGFMLIRDTDYTHPYTGPNASYCDVKYYAKTVAHEIGHAYGVKDHYSAPSELGSGWDDCIWGYNKEKDDVVKELKMCMVCKQTIMLNSDKYNQS